jgi:hypothetical protein
MNLDEIDRLISQRQQRIEQNIADGRIPFEKEKVDPIQSMKEEGQRLAKRLQDIEMLAMENGGPTEEMEEEAIRIMERINVLKEEITRLKTEPQDAEEKENS